MVNKHIIRKLDKDKINKKGIILNQTAILIIGILMVIVIIFGLMYYTGLLKGITETASTGICQASALLRGIIIDGLWVILSILLVILSLLVATGGIKAGGGGLIKGLSVVGSKTGLITYLSIGIIAMLFSSIPLMCKEVEYYQGTPAKPYSNNTLFSIFVGTKAVDCWDMYGSGNWEPLWGIDPPNPKICFTLHINLKQGTNMKEVYHKITEQNTNWKLGVLEGKSTKVLLYCPGRIGYNPDEWGGCVINDKTMYIMYKDNHPYDEFSYDSSVCEGNVDIDWYEELGQIDEDHIVICVQDD